MKKRILLISSLSIILLSHKSKAQSYNGSFKQEVTEHYKSDVLASKTTKYKSGVVIITDKTVQIGEDNYSILKKDNADLQDEGYFAQCLTLVTQTKTGTYKVMDLIIEIKPDKKTIDYVQLNKTKSTKVGYVLVN